MCRCDGAVSYTHLDVYKRQDLQYDGQLDQRAEAECGVTVEWHDLVFYGTCQTCKLKGKEPAEG